jgi:hypothetical protein
MMSIELTLHYYRKLITAGCRTPITDSFGPCWCMSAVIGDLYLRRLRAGGDSILPPSVRRTMRRWRCFTTAGPAYDRAVMICSSMPIWHTIQRWWCNHRHRPGVPSGGDDVPIIARAVYQPVVMMNISMSGRPTIWWRWREHQHQMGVPSGCDDENINAGPSYHPAVMMRISTPVRRTIWRWCRC